MEQDSRAGEAVLVKAVRALDLGGADVIPAKLQAVWNILSRHRDHGFHAAEDMLLRWLLKTMNGSSPDAERVRRYPLTWHILGAIFSWIPTFSLAQSLADRRFVNVLKQTFKEVATSSEQQKPGGDQSGNGDVEMTEPPPDRDPASSAPGSRKRKRLDTPTFDPDDQRLPSGRLLTAQALIESLRILLSRCKVDSSRPGQHPIERMGAEHIKSLFSTAASDAVEMLVPFLAACDLAVDPATEVELAGGHTAAWISVFSSIWDLHLQTAADGTDFATHLYRPSAVLLAKLSTASPDLQMEDGIGILAIDESAQRQWARDLRRFLTRNFILPLRAAFLNRGSRDLLELATRVSFACGEQTHPLFFDLVTGLPPAIGEKVAGKDSDAWVQAVFDSLTTDGLNGVLAKDRDAKLEVVQSMIKTAADRLVRISLSSLRRVCDKYAQRDIGISWTLLIHMARLNPDVFLIAEGGELLSKVLAATLGSADRREETEGLASRFVVLLAEGYARTHDLSSFIKLWLEYLARSLAEEDARGVHIWSTEDLRSAVGRVLETSLNTKQLADIVAWLSSHGDRGRAEVGARLLILESVSRGLSQEEYVDAASMEIFDIAFAEKSPSSKSQIHAEIVAAQWTIAQHAISRGTLEDAKKIWLCLAKKHTPKLRKALQKAADLDRPDRFSAFKFYVVAWLANHPGGAFEDDAADMVDVYFEGLDAAEAAIRSVYMSWIGRNAPQLVGLVARIKAAWPGILQPPLRTDDREDLESPHDYGEAAAEQFRKVVLGNENVLNDAKLSCDLLDLLIDGIENIPQASWQSSSTKRAIRLLLDVPTEILGRPQREKAMARLVSQIRRDTDSSSSPVTPAQWKPVLSLMIRLMERPTYYEGMAFEHLGRIARDLSSTAWPDANGLLGEHAVKERRECLRLFDSLMTLTLRQVTTGNLEERERTYLVEAAGILGAKQKSQCHPHSEWRLVMLRIFASTVRSSPAAVRALEGEKATLGDLESQLLSTATQSLMAACEDRWALSRLAEVLEALQALDTLGGDMSNQELAGLVPGLLGLSDSLLEAGPSWQAEGWAIRGFMAKYFRETLGSPLHFGGIAMSASPAGEDVSDTAGGRTAAALAPQEGSPGRMDQHAFLSYADAAIQSVDEDTRLDYLKELLHEEPLGGLNGTCQLLAIYRLVQGVKGSSSSSTSCPARADGFDLATAHSMLCDRLLRAPSPGAFVLVAQSVRLLLDQKAAAMTQWNIERTLSTVATLCSEKLSRSTKAGKFAKPLLPLPMKTLYPWLCRVVETIVKRHRKRLDGRFHLLVLVLQALLRALICRPPESSSSSSLSATAAAQAQAAGQTSSNATVRNKHDSSHMWEEKHARAFSRLLALICEPTHTSLQTGGGHGTNNANATATTAAATATATGPKPLPPAHQLDSERDRVRRHAGQYMYLVLMQYVRLQVGGGRTTTAAAAAAATVPRGVAAALEQPGLYAVLDVTGQDALAVMSDAMDPGGRAVVKDLYRRYQRFGKWTGV